MPLTLTDLDNTRDGLRAATEHAAREQEAADAADRRRFEKVFRDLQNAMRDADRAHAELETRKADSLARATAFHGGLATAAAPIDEVRDQVRQLRIDLATRHGKTRAQIDTMATPGHPPDGAVIEQLGGDLRQDLEDARNAADLALDDYFDKLAVAEKKRVALGRLEQQIAALRTDLEQVMANASEMVGRANRQLARAEASNDRSALVWYFFARRDRDRLDADFDDGGLEVTGGLAQFTAAFNAAWDELVDAEAALHDAALDLHRARLEEVMAAAAIRKHETSLPFGYDTEIADALAAL